MSDLRASPGILSLTREAVLRGEVQQAAAQIPGMKVLSDAEIEHSMTTTLAARPGPDLWVFGYGSLLWNPVFRHDAQRTGRVRGWHRRFCIWTSLSRGSPERPGLTLGLDRGGACGGLLYRIPLAHAAAELAVLWRREIADSSYAPRWVSADTDAAPVHAIAFTVNRLHERYTGKMDEQEMAYVIARASGRMGRCSDYLRQTVASLEAHGIHDRKLRALDARVQRLIQSWASQLHAET